ncbi:MAG: hypothetical protein JEZ04_05910 [Spirochaetales bacterium]|nr:hypothetical protein [Spirochaetales bacterium]
MNNLRRIVIVVVILIFLLGGCEQPVKPTPYVDLLEYTVDCSDQSLRVDLWYQDGNNDVVELKSQVLPWSVPVELTSAFTGEAYLKAEIPSSEVFVPFLTGTAGAVPEVRKLNDSGASFISGGVIVGDRVYIDPATAHYADVIGVDTETSISLNGDLFELGNEAYNIYHNKTLTSTIIFNGETAAEDSVVGERLLCCKVLTILDRYAERQD